MEHRKKVLGEQSTNGVRREPFRTGQPLPPMLVSWEPRESDRQKYQLLGPLEKGPGVGVGGQQGECPSARLLSELQSWRLDKGATSRRKLSRARQD